MLKTGGNKIDFEKEAHEVFYADFLKSQEMDMSQLLVRSRLCCLCRELMTSVSSSVKWESYSLCKTLELDTHTHTHTHVKVLIMLGIQWVIKKC